MYRTPIYNVQVPRLFTGSLHYIYISLAVVYRSSLHWEVVLVSSVTSQCQVTVTGYITFSCCSNQPCRTLGQSAIHDWSIWTACSCCALHFWQNVFYIFLYYMYYSSSCILMIHWCSFCVLNSRMAHPQKKKLYWSGTMISVYSLMTMFFHIGFRFIRHGI